MVEESMADELKRTPLVGSSSPLRPWQQSWSQW
jgi:hypothetical protein